ncbi:MAG: hypothetical protein D6708_11950 [Candidatus Dadabacteria bacterium]|nr:MAG: hypothetical protein D6708_11950 [Candidatus Dadabacteria bacterium]
MRKGIVFLGFVAAVLACGVAGALAGTYFGLTPGKTTWDQAKETLAAEGAAFEDNWGYRGYSELPSIKVLGYGRFSRLGAVREAWLEFSPDRVLYRISVTWGDAGETYKLVKDALDGKYGAPSTSGFGFESRYEYRDGSVRITLVRNTFGFGADQTTRLEYLYEPAVGAVEAMKAKIEADIRQKNLKRAGGDL